MKLGQLFADLCMYAAHSGKNVMEMEVLVHTVNQDDKMFPAMPYIVENKEDGTKAVHFDTPQPEPTEQQEESA